MTTMIIDGLTHILPRWFSENRTDALASDHTFVQLFANPKAQIVQGEQLLSEMDRSGVTASVIAGFGWTDYELARRSNDYLLEQAQLHPGRLIPLCSVNPVWDGDLAGEEAARCMDAGAVGIGELHADTQGWVNSNYDETLSDLMSIVQQRNGITVVHASEPLGHTYPGKGTMTPDRLLRLASTYSDNRFVYSHFGGGLPFYAHMPEVAQALQNVWYDTAAAPYLYTPTIYTSLPNPNPHLIFASDHPLLPQTRAIQHLRNSNISTEEQEAVLKRAGEVYGL